MEVLSGEELFSILYKYLTYIEFVEDETNKDNTYSRNYIRNIVMPALRKQFGADLFFSYATIRAKLRKSFGRICVTLSRIL